MITERQHERCARRAAELFTANDIVLSDLPLPDALLAALDPALRASLHIISQFNAIPVPTLCIITAHSAAVDGSSVCSEQAAACATAAGSLGIPIYVLLAGGPDPAIAHAEMLLIPPAHTQLDAEQINAFITDRGMYRPAMLARHLNDGDAPIDVIPLLA